MFTEDSPMYVGRTHAALITRVWRGQGKLAGAGEAGGVGKGCGAGIRAAGQGKPPHDASVRELNGRKSEPRRICAVVIIDVCGEK